MECAEIAWDTLKAWEARVRHNCAAFRILIAEKRHRPTETRLITPVAMLNVFTFVDQDERTEFPEPLFNPLFWTVPPV